ncbi:diaminopropionate ammonia-lyase [Tritrichomonas foetus]|uniref:Diaminopropionate ammonia-lyase n=1 Tax=Tritrichomonas foetus TaxID=1144522 RepID=A0A1J4JST8_9EUKA|nr:diaminopropionate ammonia-lyase [Tritrichomonas foetus]|eukprot:OHT01504.1 diaminopropionate ammonia-lyase [Tritrichomonas foetus]
MSGKDGFRGVFYERKDSKHGDISFLSYEEAKKARDFHASFDCYQETPLVPLKNLANSIGVKNIYVKDESFRFGLNAFKVLGGSYALGSYIAKKLNEDISQMPSQKMLSKEVKAKLGDVTFVTATDGNHGRGVAWTANRLGQHSVVYMPKGSAEERLQNIRAEGADASITDMNYDEAVRLANSKAESEGWVMVQDTAWEGYTDIPTWIMQGYTTMGVEIMKQIEELKLEKPTHIFLQAGVGSMAGAMTGFFASVFSEDRPFISIVEPNTVDCIFRTAQARDGKIHFVTGDYQTIMAGLACGEPCTIGWEVLKDYADAFLTCPDYAAADGMRVLAAPKKGDSPIVSGESGASAFGCVFNILTDPQLHDLKTKLKLDENSNILFISTEGDTDKDNYQAVVWGGKYNKY